MVKREKGSPVFDDDTSRNDAAPDRDAPEHATLIDEALSQEVAVRIRELRHEIAKRKDVEKTSLAPQPTFDEDDFPRLYSDDDQPTMWEVEHRPSVVSLDNPTIESPALGFESGSLGSAIPFSELDEPDHTERAEIPIIEPIKPPSAESLAEYTRKEPIPMELFFETAEPVAVPMSSRPKPLPKLRGRAAGPPQVLPVVEAPSEPAEQTMLDVAAQVGLAPEISERASIPKLAIDEDTFDEVAEAVKEAAQEIADEPKEGPPKLTLPDPAGPSIDLAPFIEEEKAKNQRRTPREGIASQDIRRYAQAAETTSRLIPMILGAFVVVATLYAMIAIFHGLAERKDEHVELRFLATLNGKPSELVSTDGAKMARIYIETKPPEILVLHNRAILGKTPLTIDLPIELGEEIGVELSSPYYQTWVSQVKREALSDEYRIRAELREK